MSSFESDQRARGAAEQIIGGMKMGKSPEQAAADLIQNLGVAEELVQAGLARVRERAEESRILRIPETLVDDATLPGAWYPGVTAGDRFWPALEDELKRSGLPHSAVDSIDNASRKIVSLLAPPWEKQIRTRGLVLGYVQSGKTSNFTAVLAKAADFGYRIFIVLSGVHNNLRRQTQARLEDQLVEASKTKWERNNWLPLTSLTADFGRAQLDPDSLLTVSDRYFLCVVKKNGRRLENLVGWLEGASPATLNACPILVIDDEADQASVNTAKEEQERTKINKLLVRLLSLPKVAYVGYTATPFANLFVDPQFPEDVYPRDFIVDLPRPSDYFGPERLFGRERLEHDDDDPDDGLDVIRRISESDLKHLQPPRKRAERDAFVPPVPPSLEQAFRYFVLATAARRARGQKSHSTMLVHTTSLTTIHLRYREPVRGLGSRLLADVRAGDPATLNDLSALWEEETAILPAERLGGHKWRHNGSGSRSGERCSAARLAGRASDAGADAQLRQRFRRGLGRAGPCRRNRLRPRLEPRADARTPTGDPDGDGHARRAALPEGDLHRIPFSLGNLTPAFATQESTRIRTCSPGERQGSFIMLWSWRTVIVRPRARCSTLEQCEIPFGSAAQLVSVSTVAVVGRVGGRPLVRKTSSSPLMPFTQVRGRRTQSRVRANVVWGSERADLLM